ncbi:MAG: T9SS type A sorting domain-containing protein [Candidatus Cloacimonadales bacterium]|nr:T9SS type A sorting domain-containing protein [Candidatus Cloacimonadales bacterium]
MKKTIFFIFGFLILVSLGFADVFMTEIADPNNDANARFVELYNNGVSTVDFTEGSGWRINKYTNGSATVSSYINLTGTIAAEDFYIIAYNYVDGTFLSVYGFAADQLDAVSNGTIGGNGDDTLELVDGTGSVVDFYGEQPHVDLTDTVWEFEDGRAERANGATTGMNPPADADWNTWSDGPTGGDIVDPQDAPGDFDPDAWIGTGGPQPLAISNVSRQFTVPTSAQTCDVQCDITGGTLPYTAVIKYDVNGVSQVDITMTNTVGDTYSGTIPAQSNGARVEYYVQVTDSGADAVVTSSTYGLFWGVSPISNAAGNIKAVDANGALLYDGYYCTVTGIASVNSGVFSAVNLEVYIQDAFGGINLFRYSDATSIIEGNSYTGTGQIDFYSGKSEIIPDNTTTDIVDNGFVGLISPNVMTIAQLLLAPEDYENTLVGIMHVTKDSGTWAANQNLDISDGTGSMIFRLDGDTDLDENPEPSWPKDVVGIFTQYDNTSPYDEGYQIMPRSISDIYIDGFLPVTLSSFTAEFLNDSPVLHWTTQSETDNLGWNIYRSLSETGYEDNDYTQNNSDVIAGMGISTQPTDYTFVDEYSVIEGLTYWYWLESESTTNELELFGPISLQIPIQGGIPNTILETALNPNYPNPFNPSTTISFNIEEGETGTLTIYNVKGQDVFRQKFVTGEYHLLWNAEGLSSGIYFYRLQTPSTNITKKMILMK